MTDRHETFSVGDEPRLEVTLPAADVRVIDGPPGEIDVRIAGGRDIDKIIIEQRGDTVVISTERGRFFSFSLGSVKATIAVPPATELDTKLASGDLTVDAMPRTARISVTSGDVRMRDVDGDLNVKTASGDVDIGDVGGRLSLSAAAGDLRARNVGGDAEVQCASGDVTLGRIGGRVQARSASGDVRVDAFEGSSCDCKSMSGDVHLGIPPGRTVDVDISTMSGDVRNDFDMGQAGDGKRVTLRVKTVSGDVYLAKAL